MATAVVAVVVVTVTLARHGVVMYPDGAIYQSAAVHLTEGRGLVDYTGSAVSIFPPAVATCLAGLLSAGASPGQAWALLNLLSLVAYLAASWVVFGLVAPRYRAALFIALTAGSVATGVFWGALSEPLFLATTAWFTVVFAHLVANPTRRSPRWFALLGLLASASFFVRYAGAAYIAAALLLAIVVSRRSIVAVATTACVPAVALLSVNGRITGNPMGGRLPAAVGVPETLHDALDGALRWMTPGSTLLGLIVIVAVALVLLGLGTWRPVALALAALSFGYAGFMVVSATRAPIDPLDARLLCPAALSTVACIGASLGSPTGRLVPRRLGRSAGTVAVLAVTLAAAGSVVDGTSGHSPVWRDQEVAAAVRAIDGPTFSNAPALIWLATGEDAFWLPSRGAYRSPAMPLEMADFEEYLSCSGPVTIVWINRAAGSGIYGPDELGYVWDRNAVTDVHLAGSGTGCDDPSRFGQGTGLR